MDINEAKREVVKAGLRLLDSGLIARTWGNVSCRVDKDYFVITPSGRTYDSLTEDDIVLVKIEDCSYDSNIKPSSEKGVHAEAYKLRPDCNFVIHTHQQNASAVSFLNFDLNNITGPDKDIIGDNVPIASYGLSGTKTLKKNVAKAIERTDSKAVIMRHHGAVCMGGDYDEAFAVAEALERVCGNFLTHRLEQVSGIKSEDVRDIAKYIGDKFKDANEPAEVVPYTSERVGDTVLMQPTDGGTPVSIDIKTGKNFAGNAEYPDTAELHRMIYKKRPDINAVIQTSDKEIKDYSKKSKVVLPLIDDFAQIVGTCMKTEAYDANDQEKTAKKVVRKLKGRNAVLLRGNGAVCAAGSKYDAEAVEMVVKKEIRANAAADMIGNAQYIKPISAFLERFVYTKKYSKQAKTNK